MQKICKSRSLAVYLYQQQTITQQQNENEMNFSAILFGILVFLIISIVAFGYLMMADRNEAFNSKGELRQWVWQQLAKLGIYTPFLVAFFLRTAKEFSAMGLEKQVGLYASILFSLFFLTKVESIVSRICEKLASGGTLVERIDKARSIDCFGKLKGCLGGFVGNIGAFALSNPVWDWDFWYNWAMCVVALEVAYLAWLALWFWRSTSSK